MVSTKAKTAVGVLTTFAVILLATASKPTFDNYYQNVTAEEGSSVNISCSALGEAPLTYEWYKYEDKILEDESLPIFATSIDGQSFLIINEVNSTHSGMYICLAKNEHGLSTKVYQLIVLPTSGDETDNSEGIKSIRVKSITSNSVEFSIEAANSVKSILSRYRENLNSIETSKIWKRGENYAVKDLIPGGLYEFQFMAMSSDNSTWSRIYRVTLLPDIPELIFKNLQDGTVKLQWFVKTSDIMRGTIDKYELKYFTVQMDKGETWKPSSCVITIQIPECNGSTYTISGLYKNQYYEIQIRAHTESGFGEAYRQKIYLS